VNAESEVRTAPLINGHMIALGDGHSIAIYERNGERYVAEFRDGCGSLEYADLWFRLHAGVLRWGKGRAALQSSMPLNPEMLEKIDHLHAECEARQERMLAVPRTVAAAAQRYCISAMARLRGAASKMGQTPG